MADDHNAPGQPRKKLVLHIEVDGIWADDMADHGGRLPPIEDCYWGGYTEHGELLHYVTGSRHHHALSACGLVLADAWDIPESLRGAQCKRCVGIKEKDERDELAALVGGGTDG